MREDNSWLRRPAWWGVVFGWCTLEALSGTGNILALGSTTFAHAARVSTVSAYLWIPVAMLMQRVAERFPPAGGRRMQSIAAHGLAALVACGLRGGVVFLLDPWVGWYRSPPTLMTTVLHNYGNHFFFILILSGVAHAAIYARRVEEREKADARLRAELARAELAALKNQIQPHFLFNALNSIAELVHIDPHGADHMIGKLAALLRRTLDTGRAQEVPLAEELHFLEPYLELEAMRFGKRLRVAWDVDPEAQTALVPHLALQPLIENAIRHGIAPRAAPGTVSIAARVDRGRLRLRVSDDGVGLRAGPREHEPGIGLSNMRARLEHLYGDDHRFELRDEPGGGLRVDIELPLRRARGAR